MTNAVKRYMFFWISFAIGYIFPFVYFLCKLGITKQKVTIVIPVILIGIVGIIKLCSVIPGWIKTWKPSFLKGLVKGIPIYLTTIFMISLGLLFKYILEHQVKVAVTAYFEFVFVFFGALTIGSIFDAFHLKYKELDMIDKGYVLGTVNK